MITIKDTLGNVRFSTEINTGSRRKFSLMSEDYIVLKFSVEDPVYFKLGDYTDTELGLFELVDLYKPTLNDSTGAYDYELRLDAHYYKWKNKIFKFNPEVGGSEAGWKLTATLDVHLGVFLRNLSALGYTYKGTPFEVNIDSTVAKTSKLIVYDNTNLIDALTQMAETWECEWWVEDNQIRFGRCEFGDPVDFVINENVERMPREESKATFATRVYAFGSTRNIPNDYRPVDESVVVNGIVQKRLMMPTGVSYVDAYPDMTTEEAVEDVVIFDDIYPRRTGTMSSVTPVERTENVENEDGSTTQQKYTVYQFKDTGITFSKDYILPGEELRIVFQTGAMAGMDFAVTFNPDNLPEKLEDGSWNPQAQLWEIVRNEDYGRMLPADTLIPSNGDTYNLYGFDSTSPVFEDMIKRAEEELEEKARDYVEKTKIDPNTYPCTMMSDYMYNDGNVRTNEFTVGARINLINPAYFENGRVSRVIGFEFDLDIPYFSPTFTIGETASYSRIGEIEDKVDELTYKGQVFTGTGSGVYVIGTNDNTPPTNKNVYSALKVLREFVRYQGWVNQPVRTFDPVKFNSVTSTDFESKLKGWIIDALGNAEFRDLLIRSFKSWNFAAGPLGAGVGMVNDDELQTDKLLVRKTMYVLEMMIQRMRFQGGIMVLSPATGFKIDRVETFDTYYRVYCRPEDFNEFEVNDQARIQNFTGNNIKYLWSLVLSRGDDYIDISRVDKDGDGVPAEGDEIVQLGNRTNPDRQDAVLLSAVNGEVGIFTYYGINSFDLSNKEGSWLGKHGGKKGAVIRGEVHITAGSSGLEQFDEYDDVDKRIQDAKDSADSVQEVVNNLTSIIIPDMQGQIDGSIMSHEGKVPPTLTNEPAVNWTTEEEKNRHIGDYYDYYLTVDGEQVTERYKFSKVNGTYQWVRVADSGSALAASVAREALGLAGTKATITWGNTLPEAPYNINDMWIKLDGSMYICNHQRLDGETGSQSDWQLFNDTMLRLAKMADDNVITKEEKATLRDTWNQIQKEFTAYQAQATKYGVSITALQNAYNTLNTFLTNTVKIAQDIDSNLSVAQKTEYNQDFANYYSERTAFANVIAQKVADESVGNLQIGMVNLLKGSNVELNKQNYNVGRYYWDKIPETGKTYTLVVCYTLGTNNTYISAYSNVNIGSVIKNFSTHGDKVVESHTFTPSREFGDSIAFYQFPNDGTYGSKVHWAVLVEGNKGPNSWIPSQADNDAKAQAIAKAEAELAETKANAYADGIVTEAEQNAINEAQARLDALKIGSVNLISKKMMLAWNEKNKDIAVWGQDSDGIYLAINQGLLYTNVSGGTSRLDCFLGEGKYKANTQYVFSVEWKLAGAQTSNGVSFWATYTDGTNDGMRLDGAQTSLIRESFITAKGKTVTKIYASVGANTYRSLIYALALYEGNKVLAEPPVATEDLTGQSNVNLVDGGKEVTVTSSASDQWGNRSLVIPKLKPNTVYYLSFKAENLTGSPTVYSAILYNKETKTSYFRLDSVSGGIMITPNNFTEGEATLLLYAGKGGSTAGNSVKFTDVMLVEGFTPPSSYSPSPGDVDQAIQDAIAKTVDITSPSQVFKYGPGYTGTPTPSSIVLTATPRNFTPTSYQWQFLNGSTWINITIDGASSTYSVNPNSTTLFPSGTNVRTFRCICNGDEKLSDSFTLAKLADGATGQPGADGRGVKSTAVTYQSSTSGTTVPTGTWSASIPAVAAGSYLWTKTVITYTSGDPSTMYSVARMGTNGTNGNNGNGVSSTVITYQASTSGTTAPTGTWGSTIPSVPAGQYLWTRTVINYTNGSSSTIYSVGMTGKTGADGKDAYTILLGNESHAFAGSTAAALAGSTTCSVVAYKGATRVAATIGTISGLPTGMTASVASNGTTEPVITFTVTTSMNTASGTVNIPVTVDGKTFTKVFSYSIAFRGDPGESINGKMLYKDPEFKKGLNETMTYGAQNGGGTVVISRTKKSTGQNQAGSLTSTEAAQIKEKLAGSPYSESDWCLYIKCHGGTSTGHLGGFYFGNQSRANAVFIVIVSAKIPVGYTLKNAHNSHGTGYKQEFLTPMVGTGKYETYIFKETCGPTGTFSTVNHLHLSGPVKPESDPLEWFVDYATVFDMTADGYGDIEFSAKDDLAQQLGYSNFDKMVENAAKDETIIKGAYINTQLIDVETLVADTALVDKLIGRELNFTLGSVGGFKMESTLLYSGAKFGTGGAGIAMQSMTNNYGFNVYKDNNNYMEMFQRSSEWGLKGVVGGNTILQLGSTNKIGGFDITDDRIGSIFGTGGVGNGMSLYDFVVKFKSDNSEDSRFAALGTSVYPSSTAQSTLLRLEETRSGNLDNILSYFYCSGASGVLDSRNIAIKVGKGDVDIDNGNLNMAAGNFMKMKGQIHFDNVVAYTGSGAVTITADSGHFIYLTPITGNPVVSVSSGLPIGSWFIIAHTTTAGGYYYIKLSGSDRFRRRGNAYQQVNSHNQDPSLIFKVSDTTWIIGNLPVNWIDWN